MNKYFVTQLFDDESCTYFTSCLMEKQGAKYIQGFSNKGLFSQLPNLKSNLGFWHEVSDGDTIAVVAHGSATKGQEHTLVWKPEGNTGPKISYDYEVMAKFFLESLRNATLRSGTINITFEIWACIGAEGVKISDNVYDHSFCSGLADTFGTMSPQSIKGEVMGFIGLVEPGTYGPFICGNTRVHAVQLSMLDSFIMKKYEQTPEEAAVRFPIPEGLGRRRGAVSMPSSSGPNILSRTKSMV